MQSLLDIEKFLKFIELKFIQFQYMYFYTSFLNSSFTVDRDQVLRGEVDLAHLRPGGGRLDESGQTLSF